MNQQLVVSSFENMIRHRELNFSLLPVRRYHVNCVGTVGVGYHPSDPTSGQSIARPGTV